MTPKKFIEELFQICPKDQFIEISRIVSNPNGETKGRKRSSVYRLASDFLKDFDNLFPKIITMNRGNNNIYFGACPRIKARDNGRAARDEDVEIAVALWADTDDKSHNRKWVDDSIDALRKSNLEPSIVVETGHGRHFWWLLEKPVPIKDALWAMAGLHNYLQGDNVYNPGRIMRLPGTKNVKDPSNPKDCSVSSATQKRYPIEAFDEIKEDPSTLGTMDDDFDDNEIDKANREGDNEIQIILKGVTEPGRNNAATKLAGHYLGKKLSKEEALDALQSWNERNIPPLKSSELKTVINSISSREEKKKSKKQGRGRGEAGYFFREKEFLPMLATNYICEKHTFLATPIGRDGIGTNLYVYKNGSYQSGGETLIESEIRKSLQKEATPFRISQVTQLARAVTKKEFDSINQKSEELINVKNGMLNWETGELLPHNPSYFSTIQINAEYNPSAQCEKIDSFLSEIFPEDCMDLAEEFIGYLLIPTTKYHKCFVAVGKGGNGKGTFLKIVECLIGVKNVSHVSLHEIAEDKFAASNLFSKLANVYHDLEERMLQRTGLFKTIVSGDPISAQEKYKNMFDFEPFARLVFSANNFPRSSDRSNAFYDRLIFVHFPNTFRGTNLQITNYDKILIEGENSRSHLLNRALKGLQRLEKNGKFSIQKSSLNLIEEYRRENSSAYDFIKEKCILEDPLGFITKKEMYQNYVMWTEEEGYKTLSSKQFTKVLKDLGLKEHRRETSRGWKGVSWNEENRDISSFEPPGLDNLSF